MAKRPVWLRGVAGWLIMALLFAQVVVAAHACAPTPARATPHANASHDGMPCPHMSAMAQHDAVDVTVLCHHHCHSTASAQADDLPLTAAAVLVALLLFVRPTLIALPANIVWRMQRRRRDRAPPLPHSVLHCCYRI